MRKLLLLAIAVLGMSTAQAQKITAQDFAKYSQAQVGQDVGMGFVMTNIYANGNTVVYVAEVPASFAPAMRAANGNPSAMKTSKDGVIRYFNSLKLGPIFIESKVNIKYVYQYNRQTLATVVINWYDF